MLQLLSNDDILAGSFRSWITKWTIDICRIYFSVVWKSLIEVEMTLDGEFNGMVLGYKRLKRWVYSSDKRLQSLCDFFFNPCCCIHWLSVIISVATGPKNVFNTFSIQLKWMLRIVNISVHNIAYFCSEFYRSGISHFEYHSAKALQGQKLVTLKPLRLHIEI